MGGLPLPARWAIAIAGALGALVLALFAGAAAALGGAAAALAPGAAAAEPSARALAEIPAEVLLLYRNAAASYGLDWAVLAAIGAIESDHGRSTAAGVHAGLNAAGCCAGPMQFSVVGGSTSTWAVYGVDGNGDGRRDVYDLADAIPAAARFLRANGAPADYRRAIFAYNHAGWYVDRVLALASLYRGSIAPAPSNLAAVTAEVLGNARIVLSPAERSDLSAGLIDVRVVTVLALIGERHSLVVTALRSDHGALTSAGRPSDHAFGRAVDIGAVDGQRCDGSRTGNCGLLAIQLAGLQGWLHSTELIYCFDPDGAASNDAFASPDHCNHIHLGYRR